MAASSSLQNSSYVPESFTTGIDVSKSIGGDTASDIEALITELKGKLQSATLNADAFLNQITDHACQLTQADSAVVALRRQETITCAARSGLLGPALGTPMNSRAGISGECIRQAMALTCTDTDTDSRVDAEVCRRLGIRSVVAVPVFDGSLVIGLLEAFSSRTYAFQDAQAAILKKLASLLAEFWSQTAKKESLLNNQDAPAPGKTPVVVPMTTAREERRSRWLEAFYLRPYQIAIVIGFLLLDVGILFWWYQR